MSESESESEERPELDLPETDETLEDGEPELDEWWSWGNFARLFIFPLVIVVVSVAIYGTFQMMLRDQTTIKEYITRIRGAPENERWRAAYSLAQSVRSQEAKKKLTRSSVNSIIELYRTAEQSRIRQYLALVLAEAPVTESVQALKAGLKSSDSGVKVNSALALGRLYENASNGIVKEEVRAAALDIAKLLDDGSVDVRRMAAFVLGSLENREVIGQLKSTLNDSADEVRWNGAIALGRLGSDAGEDVLTDVLQRAKNGRFSDWEPGLRRNLLTNTAEALSQLESKNSISLLRNLYNNDEDSKVRKAALEAIQSIESSG